MGRPLRNARGDIIYHVLNRANNRSTIFYKDLDYYSFENILEEAKEKCPIRILSYELMPNHWHLALHPYNDGDLTTFMQWISLTHTQRYKSHYQKIGFGHLYQGRYKSFPVASDEYFIQLCRYIESNAFRAGLVGKAEDWRWSSLWRRVYGNSQQKKLLDPWPIVCPKQYLELVNTIQNHDSLSNIRKSVHKGSPLGNKLWIQDISTALSLESTLRNRGHQPKGVRYL